MTDAILVDEVDLDVVEAKARELTSRYSQAEVDAIIALLRPAPVAAMIHSGVDPNVVAHQAPYAEDIPDPPPAPTPAGGFLCARCGARKSGHEETPSGFNYPGPGKKRFVFFEGKRAIECVETRAVCLACYRVLWHEEYPEHPCQL